MISVKTLVRFLFAAVLCHWATAQTLACTACFGQSDSRMAQGMNMGIFALLLMITIVLAGVASFFVFLARRSAHLENGASMQPATQPTPENRTNA
jgi:hypothetical protein